jgi:hypothetical protein
VSPQFLEIAIRQPVLVRTRQPQWAESPDGGDSKRSFVSAGFGAAASWINIVLFVAA